MNVAPGLAGAMLHAHAVADLAYRTELVGGNDREERRNLRRCTTGILRSVELRSVGPGRFPLVDLSLQLSCPLLFDGFDDVPRKVCFNHLIFSPTRQPVHQPGEAY